MNCTNCGKPLTTDAAFCPTCGASTPYATPGQGVSSPDNATQASPYGSGQNYPPFPPTVPANPEGYSSQAPNPDNYPPQSQAPYPDYGAAMSQQAPYNSYNTPGYEGGTPPQPPPFNSGGPGPYYGASPTPGYAPGTYAPPPKKRSKVGLIIGICVLALVLLCGGLLIAAAQIGKQTATSISNSASTAVATTTDATTPTSNTPANGDVVPAAARILFKAQTTSAVDANYEPQNVTTTFATGKEVDVTFNVDSAGKDGYIKVRWYEDDQEVDSTILTHHAANDHGYFGETYTTAGNGVAALYWCTTSNCSDEQLAQVVNFTITGSATVPATNNSLAMRDWKVLG